MQTRPVLAAEGAVSTRLPLPGCRPLRIDGEIALSGGSNPPCSFPAAPIEPCKPAPPPGPALAARLTSLERVLGHRPAEDAQAGAVVGGHLDLVLRPDDELGHQAVVDLGAGDVALLVLPGQPGQAVPAQTREVTRRDITQLLAGAGRE